MGVRNDMNTPPDPEARDRLVLDNLSLIWPIARRASSPRYPIDDAFMYGVQGLIHAADIWQPERGAFSTVAVWQIIKHVARGRLIFADHNHKAPLSLDKRVRAGIKNSPLGDLIIGDDGEMGAVIASIDLDRALSELTAKERAILVTMDLQHASSKEAAQALGYKSRQGVYCARRRAFEKIRGERQMKARGRLKNP